MVVEDACEGERDHAVVAYPQINYFECHHHGVTITRKGRLQSDEISQC